MSFVKNSINFSDLEIHQEINYHSEQAAYHSKKWLDSFEDALSHLKTMQRHCDLWKEYAKQLNAEVPHVL